MEDEEKDKIKRVKEYEQEWAVRFHDLKVKCFEYFLVRLQELRG